MKYEAGQKVEVVLKENGHHFEIGDIVEVTEVNDEDTQIRCVNSSGVDWYLQFYEVKPAEEQGMKIKTNDKVKFADCAKHLKSYDAGAVGVVMKVWDGQASGKVLVSVAWVREDDSTFNTTNINVKNLELISVELEQPITLQPGDYCEASHLSSDQCRVVFDAFENAGFPNGESRYIHTFSGHFKYVGCTMDGQVVFTDETFRRTLTRQLTYSQIVNATNAKPKPTASEAIKSLGEAMGKVGQAMGSVASAEPEPKQTLDSAVQELTEVTNSWQSLQPSASS